MSTKEESCGGGYDMPNEVTKQSVSSQTCGYSLTKCFDNGSRIELGTFDLAGDSITIKYFPKVYYSLASEYISFLGTIVTQTSMPFSFEYVFCLLDQDGKSSVPQKGRHTIKEKECKFGPSTFMSRFAFEKSDYLNDDCFTFECSTLRVVKPSYIDMRKKLVVVQSSDLHQQFAKLLESKEGTDVTFEVTEETFIAHKNVLAGRSFPVFKAQFFGSMMESASGCVKIEDVKPKVFKLILHFIYTDNLPVGVEVTCEMAQHLLVAADRYGLERLKLISAEILCENLSVENSATTLVLAEQHNCRQLKEACVDFVSSRAVLNDVMASEGFGHLVESCPLLLKELLEKVDNGRRF